MARSRRSSSKWDCRYDLESTEATLFQHFYRHVVLEIFGHEKGIGWRRMFYLCTRMGFSSMVLTAVDRTLRKVTSAWWRGRDKGELVRRAAAAPKRSPCRSGPSSIRSTSRTASSAPTRAGRGSSWASARNRSACPAARATPFQGHLLTTATRESSFAPSYHMVTDLGTDEAWTNLPGGPSENRFSKWYKVDIPRWLAGQYKRLARERS